MRYFALASSTAAVVISPSIPHVVTALCVVVLVAAAGRSERRELVVNLRADGLSTRAIASAAGASEATVRRDLPTASVDAVAPVVGVNGKAYESRRPPITPAEVAELTPRSHLRRAGVCRDVTGC